MSLMDTAARLARWVAVLAAATLLGVSVLIDPGIVWWLLLWLVLAGAAAGLVVGAYLLVTEQGRRGWLIVGGGAASAAVAFGSFQTVMFDSPPPSAVTTIAVPVTSSAELVDDDHWNVTDVMTIDATDESRPQLDADWTLLGDENGRLDYRRTTTVPAELARFQTTGTTFPVPTASDAEHSTIYSPDDGSELTVLAPRYSVHGTTPTSDDAKATGDVDLYATEVAFGHLDDQIDVAMTGTLLRSAAGNKISELVSLGWWSIFLAAIVGVALWLGRETLGAIKSAVWGWLTQLFTSNPPDADEGARADRRRGLGRSSAARRGRPPGPRRGPRPPPGSR